MWGDVAGHELTEEESDIYFYFVNYEIKIDKKYEMKPQVNYLVHHLFQMINPTFKYIKFHEYPPIKDTIQWVLDYAVNRHHADNWRSLSEKDVSLDMFLALDDIEFVNKQFKTVASKWRQTNLLESLKNKNEKEKE